LKRYFQGLYDTALKLSKNTSFEKDMNIPSFGTTKVPILGLPFENAEKK
jgi:hypothetical protein